MICLLCAAVFDSGVNLFIPKVASSVRIDDLARYLIVCARGDGLDARVIYTGLRVADKMHERFISRTESIRKDWTGENLRAVESPKPDEEVLGRAMYEIQAGGGRRKVERVMGAIREAVPEYEVPNAAHPASAKVCS